MNCIKINLLKITLIFFILFCSLQALLFSQEISFKNFDTKNGLPSKQVYRTYQDKNGVLWFATDRGICSYNGYEFVTYGLEDGLTSNVVFDFYEQEDGKIWCTTINNRLFYFDPNIKKFHLYKYNDLLSEHAQDFDCSDLYIDKNKTLHISFKSNALGVVSIDSKGKLLSRQLRKQIEFAKNKIVLAVISKNSSFSYLTDSKVYTSISENNIILTEIPDFTYFYKAENLNNFAVISTANMVFFFKSGKLIKKFRSSKLPLNVGFIDDSHFYVSYTKGGVEIFDLNGNSVDSFLHDESATHVFKDHDGGYWVSTLYSGVFYCPSIAVRHYFLEKSSNTHSLAKDGFNNLLVSLSNGNVYKKNDSKFDLIYKTDKVSPSNCQYYDVFKDVIIFGYSDFKLMEKGPINLGAYNDFAYAREVSEEREYNPVIGSSNGLLKCLNSKWTLLKTKKRIRAVCNINDSIYLGTTDGLFYNGLKDAVIKKLGGNNLRFSIADISKFNKREIAIATLGKGVLIFDRETEKYKSITIKDGLKSNLINKLFIENDSVMWVCSVAGLSRVLMTSNNSYQINSITTFEGLIDDDIKDIEIINDTIWLASASGLSCFHKSLIENGSFSKKVKCFLNIETIKVNDNLVGKSLFLNHNENRIEFAYQAISFKGNNNISYRYRLIGIDNNWNYTTNRNVVFSALPPGEYKFEVEAGVNGNWGDMQIVPFIIYPPFYKTIWFIVVLILVIVFLIYLFFRFRILSYNRDIIRELLRVALKKIKRNNHFFVVKEKGRNVKINSLDVLYARSIGNYIEIQTEKRRFIVREKISNFLEIVPDPIEYVQIHRSHIVRIDKVTGKSSNSVFINEKELSVGGKYMSELDKIHLA